MSQACKTLIAHRIALTGCRTSGAVCTGGGNASQQEYETLITRNGSHCPPRTSQARIGGLITSTLLTLVVVPVVYTFLDDLGRVFARWWHRGTPEHALINHRVPEAVE